VALGVLTTGSLRNERLLRKPTNFAYARIMLCRFCKTEATTELDLCVGRRASLNRIRQMTGVLVTLLKSLVAAIFVCHVAVAQTCTGKFEHHGGGIPSIWNLDDGGIAAFARMNIDLDGYRRAYHPKNFAAGAVVHICNAGKVYLPDGSYQGSENNTTCTGRFMEDYKRIGNGRWQSSYVGAINWYGIVAQDVAIIHGETIRSVKPVFQKDGSGFYASPTSLQDPSIGIDDQDRYINSVRVAYAVIPRNFEKRRIELGSFGVAVDRRRKIGIPFIVGDIGPKIGEGSAALARLVAGLPLTDAITLKNRNAGQVDTADILWFFFCKRKGALRPRK
jgi:Fungal chitosanase of glycosyl hydrolase group 75